MKRLLITWMIFIPIAGLLAITLDEMGLGYPHPMPFIAGIISFLIILGLVSTLVKD